MTFLRLCFCLLLLGSWAHQGYGQSSSERLDRMDFSRIRVDDLTDEQIEEVLDRAEAQGLSLSELEKMALTRGMRPSEVIKLRERIAKIRLDRRQGGRNEAADPTARRDRERPTDRTRDGDVPGDEGALDEDDPFNILTAARDTYRTRRDSTDEAFEEARDTVALKVFGADLFRSETLTFAPSLNIPTPENYQLGAGDELVIDVWGAAEQTYQVTVNPEGTIRIENLGPVYVNGLTIEEAERRILGRLSQLYEGLGTGSENGVSASVSLGRVRSIRVHILGEVRYPGTYTLPALATVFNALYVCSGPNDNGTFRNIQVLRAGRVISTLDVYDFLVYGRMEDNVFLQDQDIVKVDPYVRRVSVEGEVKRPGLFETKPGETLADLIRFAGSYTGAAYTRNLKVYRKTDVERRIVTVSERQDTTFTLENGDEVYVDPILNRFANRVEIRGAVYRKGDYELEEAKTVRGLIDKAEGLRGDAFLTRGHIYRTRDDLTTELISFSLGDVMTAPAQHDIVLRKDDIVVIPSIFELKEEHTVEIAGAINRPDVYPFMENMTLKDLIVMAGGLKEEASLLRVEVSRRRVQNATETTPSKIADIFYFDVDRDLALTAGSERFVLKPYDEVFIRRSPGYIAQRNVRIGGEIRYPGTYTIEDKGDRISDIIERAGGLTMEAYQPGARLFRTHENAGAVGIDLGRILSAPGSAYDLLVEDGDSLYVPLRLETVKVGGAVYSPASTRFNERFDLMDYVNQAGGPTDQADVRKAYVLYANGTIDRVRRTLFFRRYPRIEPGAQIIIPVKPQDEQLSSEERTLVLSSIVSIAALVSTTIFQIIQATR